MARTLAMRQEEQRQRQQKKTGVKGRASNTPPMATAPPPQAAQQLQPDAATISTITAISNSQRTPLTPAHANGCAAESGNEKKHKIESKSTFDIDSTIRSLSKPSDAKAAFQHTLNTEPAVRDLDQNVAQRFWFAAHYFGLSSYLKSGLTMADWAKRFNMPDLEGRNAMIDRKLKSLQKITQVWPADFWALLAEKGVRLPREPTAGFTTKLSKITTDWELDINEFAVKFIDWLPRDLKSRNEGGRGSALQRNLWKAGMRDVTEIDIFRFLDHMDGEGIKKRKEEAAVLGDSVQEHQQISGRKRGLSTPQPSTSKRIKRSSTDSTRQSYAESSSSSPLTSIDSLESDRDLDRELDELDEIMGLSSPLPSSEKDEITVRTNSRTSPSVVMIHSRSTASRGDGASNPRPASRSSPAVPAKAKLIANDSAIALDTDTTARAPSTAAQTPANTTAPLRRTRAFPPRLNNTPYNSLSFTWVDCENCGKALAPDILDLHLKEKCKKTSATPSTQSKCNAQSKSLVVSDVASKSKKHPPEATPSKPAQTTFGPTVSGPSTSLGLWLPRTAQHISTSKDSTASLPGVVSLITSAPHLSRVTQNINPPTATSRGYISPYSYTPKSDAGFVAPPSVMYGSSSSSPSSSIAGNTMPVVKSTRVLTPVNHASTPTSGNVVSTSTESLQELSSTNIEQRSNLQASIKPPPASPATEPNNSGRISQIPSHSDRVTPQSYSSQLSKLTSCRQRVRDAKIRYTHAVDAVKSTRAASHNLITNNSTPNLRNLVANLSADILKKTNVRATYERARLDVAREDPAAAPEVQILIDLKDSEIARLGKEKEVLEDALLGIERKETEEQNAKVELEDAIKAEGDVLWELQVGKKVIEQAINERKKEAETLKKRLEEIEMEDAEGRKVLEMLKVSGAKIV